LRAKAINANLSQLRSLPAFIFRLIRAVDTGDKAQVIILFGRPIVPIRRTLTDSTDAEKQPGFRHLHRLPVCFEPLHRNHRLILNNLLLYFGTFSTAYLRNQVP
jgi:hypothetical protein